MSTPPAAPTSAVNLPELPDQVPRRQMIWITWRQHRAGFLGFAALLGGLALVMVAIGLRAHVEYSALPQCGRTGKCALNGDMFDEMPFDVYPVSAGLVLHVVAALIGMFLGAPLLARELEAGTFRFAWTQGMGRVRWTAAKMLLIAVTAAAASCVLGAVFTWSYRPYVPLGVDSSWQGVLFDVSVVTLAGWTLAAFALGALAGTLMRRTVAAMALTATCVAALAGVSWWQLDNLLLSIAPLTIRTAPYYTAVPSRPGLILLNSAAGRDTGHLTGSWLVRSWYTGPGGHPMTAAQVKFANNAMPGNGAAGQLHWLARHHDAYWVAYQPASRFWVFQALDGTALLLLALILAAAVIWRIRCAA